MISRILTVRRLAMCCGPVYIQPWMPCERAWFRHGCFGQRMLSEHERYYGLRMDALVSVCSRNTNVIMVCGHGCFGQPMLSEHERYMVCGHGCFGQRMLRERECHCGLFVDALVSVLCSWNTNLIMVCAWMLWSAYAPGT